MGELGERIVVEAKQYDKETALTRNFIDVAEANMVRINADTCFFVSTGKLSKKSPAGEAIRDAYVRGKMILFISWKDIVDISTEETTLPMLISKGISDLRMNKYKRMTTTKKQPKTKKKKGSAKKKKKVTTTPK